MPELTIWHSPRDPRSQADLIRSARTLANQASTMTGQQYHPNVLLPTHYGNKFPDRPTAPDLKIKSVADVSTRRAQIEVQGVGFGSFGVPLDHTDVNLAADVANAAGFYVADVEGGAGYWTPGDDPAASQQWVNAFHARCTLDHSNLAVTIVPNDSQLKWSDATLNAWISLGTRMCVEIYGGPKTGTTYKYPNLWPIPSYFRIDDRFQSWATWRKLTTVVPVMDVANFADDFPVFARLSGGNVHVWSA